MSKTGAISGPTKKDFGPTKINKSQNCGQFVVPFACVLARPVLWIVLSPHSVQLN